MLELRFFAGTWEGEGEFWSTEFSPSFSQPVLRVEAAFRLGGHWLEQRFTWIEQPGSGGAPDVVEAARLWGYDQAQGLLVSEWFDNRGRRATVTSPGWKGDELAADAVILHAERKIRAQETFTRRDENS
ncbi:hypothetical protein [Nonomuraea sp. NPDC049695]|uniref:hypothetical protein n=1 Tax=Nonomuraea sp. NPDC049695 TaxID=3154734 RepID=UPI0034418705